MRTTASFLIRSNVPCAWAAVVAVKKTTATSAFAKTCLIVPLRQFGHRTISSSVSGAYVQIRWAYAPTASIQDRVASAHAQAATELNVQTEQWRFRSGGTRRRQIDAHGRPEPRRAVDRD